MHPSPSGAAPVDDMPDMPDDGVGDYSGVGSSQSDAVTSMEHWAHVISLLVTTLLTVITVVMGARSPSTLVMVIGILGSLLLLLAVWTSRLSSYYFPPYIFPPIAFFLLLLTVSILPGEVSRSYYEKGKTCFDQQDYECAIKNFDSAIELDSTNAKTLSQRGHTNRGMGNYDKALSDYDEALRLNPKDAGTLYYRAWINSELGNYDSAILDLDQAIFLDPDAPYFYYERAYAYFKNGDTQKAILDYQNTISRAGDDNIELKRKAENIILTIVPPAPPSTPVLPSTEQRRTLFEDDFRSVKRTWRLGDFSNESVESSFQIVDDAYRMKATYKTGQLTEWTRIPDFSAKDFGLGLNAKILSASSNDAFSIAVAFRWKDGDNFYLVRFAQDGSFNIMVRKKGNWSAVAGRTPNTKINLQKGVENRFDIFVQGTRITLFVGGQSIFAVEDTALTEAGSILIGVDSSQPNQTIEVEFDDIVIVDK